MAKWKGKEVSSKRLFDLKEAAARRKQIVRPVGDVQFYMDGKLIANGSSLKYVTIEK